MTQKRTNLPKILVSNHVRPEIRISLQIKRSCNIKVQFTVKLKEKIISNSLPNNFQILFQLGYSTNECLVENF